MPQPPSSARAWVWTVLLLAVAGALQAPTTLLMRDPSTALGLLGLSTLVSAVAATLALFAARAAELAPSRAAVVEGVLCGLFVHAPLAYEPAIVFSPILLVGTFVFTVALAGLRWQSASRWPEGSRPVALALGGGAALAYGVNLVVKAGHNPGFHLWLWLMTAFLLWQALHLMPRREASRGAWGALAVMSSCALWGVFSPAAQSLFRSYLFPGRALVLLVDDPSVDPGAPMAPEQLDTAQAWASFDELTAMPEAPRAQLVEGKNVLVIHVDALRYDATSLANPELERTPRMRALAALPGSYDFADAHAPAGSTFQSSLAAFAGRPISSVEVSVGSKDWFGEVQPEARLLPDAMRELGYRSSWVGHNHKRIFTQGIRGLTERFEVVELHAHEQDDPEADRNIVANTIGELDRASEDGRPFFLWCFLVSPHNDYVPHDGGSAATSERERYEQEVAFVDARVGEVLDALRERGLAGDTIVVLSSDHGEEFGEHGARYHARHVYEEARHVPLVIHVPGSPGARVEAPVSTGYVWPWLLGRRGLSSDAFFDASVREGLAPYLRVTEGAVLSEHLGRQNMHSALIYRDYSVTYDFHGRRSEVFERKSDPYEGRDLSNRENPRVAELLDTMQRYRALRRSLRRFDLDGREKLSPRPD